MSAILKMLEAADKVHIGLIPPNDYGAEFAIFTKYAVPDLQRLVSWVESAEHAQRCMWWELPAGSSECDCGLTAVQSLIRS